MSDLLERGRALLEDRNTLAATIVVGSVFAAFLASFVVRHTLGVLARQTKTDLDDKIIRALRRPIWISVVLYGTSWAADVLVLRPRLLDLLISILQTVAVGVWTVCAFRIGHSVLDAISNRVREDAIVQPRTVPIFDMVVKIAVAGAAVYFIFLAWDIDVTAWLASAGIIGIAVGFAAKDSLANLFSGIFIIADAPYKINDWIVLDGGLRGRVTAIGIRSTRIVTRDDIEITIPNAIIGASKIMNEAGGPYIKQRIAVTVEVAYGSDIDKARKVLLEQVEHPLICSEPAPMVRFREFGGSGLVHQLLVWIEDPSMRGFVVDLLNSRVYKALGAAGIEIPYSKHDVFIKQMPAPPPVERSEDVE